MISVLKYAVIRSFANATVPWLASMIVFESLTNGRIAVGELLRARRFVVRDRHLAEEHLDFGQHALGNRLAGDGERRRVRRMAMHDAR